jgi:hypothetical protein
MANQKDRRPDLEKVQGSRDLGKRDGGGPINKTTVSFDKPIPPEKPKKG